MQEVLRFCALPWDRYIPFLPGNLSGLQIQASVSASTVTNTYLSAFKDRYKIIDEFTLLCSSPKDMACFPPLSCYSGYEEHLKFGISFPPHPIVLEVLRFSNLSLGRYIPFMPGNLSGLLLFVRRWVS